ncbi:MAG: thiopurine S-methyltransferase [Bacteroidia bacterium]|nr:thiopurine S-methyltransferase [Bacteroidia bacterium]
MQADFWIDKWETRKIGFHLSDANPLLVKHLHHLNLEAGNRIFLPLCGKTMDIPWLMSQGFEVVGNELSLIAVEELFESMAVVPKITTNGKLNVYTSEGLTIYQGDFFEVSSELLGGIDAIFDRAALVALPNDMRLAYSNHLMDITNRAPQLLVSFEYDQSKRPGPPFSVDESMIMAHYSQNYDIRSIERIEEETHLDNIDTIVEQVWLLNPK